MRISDWSSDVCSSDLFPVQENLLGGDDAGVAEQEKSGAETDHPGIAVDEEQAEQHQEVAEIERIAGGAEAPASDQRVGVDPLIHAAALDVDEPDDRRAQHLRSEERRVGKECVSRVDLGCRRIIKKKNEQ